MSSDRPSKRRKLANRGSMYNPIYVSSSEFKSQSPEPKPEPEPDSLNHLLNSLDELDRNTHLGILMASVKVAEERLHDATSHLGIYQRTSAIIQDQIERTRYFADTVNEAVIEHDTRIQDENRLHGVKSSSRYEKDRRHRDYWIALANSALEETEGLLVKQGRLYAHTRGLYEALSRWVGALDDLSGLWEIIWDLYDSMTSPGPRSAPRKIRRTWDDRLRMSLWQDLIRIEGAAQAAEREVNEAESAMAAEAPQTEEDEWLSEVARIIARARAVCLR